MTPEFFAKGIGLPEDAVAAALSLEITPAAETVMRQAYGRGQDDFAEAAKKTADPNLWVLALYLKWGAEAYDKWHAAGIPDEVYFDTFKDITLWSNRYRERTGKIGLIEWHWFIVHMGMKLFRLGRLQFEITELKEDTPLAPKGTEVLSVHIPRGESLTAENIRESLERSKKFFPEHFGKEYSLYYCCSWLLAPQLEEMLSEKSGIRDLRKYFTVFAEDLSYSQAEDYVFLQKAEDPSTYPQNTTLQKNLRRFLLEGGKMGMGKGIFSY